MSFRFRKRVRLFPGVALNFSKNGLSSLSLGPRGATVNVPLARDGGTRVTAGIPGTGLSWTEEVGCDSSRPRSTAQRRDSSNVPPHQYPALRQVIDDVMGTLCGPGHVGEFLWTQGLVQKVLDHDDTPRNVQRGSPAGQVTRSS